MSRPVAVPPAELGSAGSASRTDDGSAGAQPSEPRLTAGERPRPAGAAGSGRTAAGRRRAVAGDFASSRGQGGTLPSRKQLSPAAGSVMDRRLPARSGGSAGRGALPWGQGGSWVSALGSRHRCTLTLIYFELGQTTV